MIRGQRYSLCHTALAFRSIEGLYRYEKYRCGLSQRRLLISQLRFFFFFLFLEWIINTAEKKKTGKTNSSLGHRVSMAFMVL
jgi:hypothetical protein